VPSALRLVGESGYRRARTTEVLAVLPARMASYAGTVDEAATMVR
jgi:hypothetical protein